MPTYHYHVTDIVPASQYGERSTGTARLTDYDEKQHNKWNHQSTYSAHAVRELVKSFGVCCTCKRETDLVNGYCAECRTLGANEAEIMGMAHSSETGRKNSAQSSWRMK